jgi:hypothetical protein
MPHDEEVRAIQEIADRVAQAHPAVDRDLIDQLVETHHREFDGRPVRDYVPLFVERRVLKHLGSSQNMAHPAS